MKNYIKIFFITLILLSGTFFQTKAYDIFSAMIDETRIQQSKACFKKTLATLNQALLMSETLNDKTYTNFNDVWNLGIKEQLANPKDIQNGVILADLTHVYYSKTGKLCTKAPDEKYASKSSACAILTIDVNGLKEPNIQSSTQKINDRYTVLLYSNRVLTIPNSVEWNMINENKKRRNY